MGTGEAVCARTGTVPADDNAYGVSPLSDSPAAVRRAVIRPDQGSATSFKHVSVKLTRSNLFGDVFFDNIWSDMAFHQKIMDASRRLDAVAAAIRDGAQRVNARTGEAEHLAQGAGRELDTARKQLDGVRREIFERAANPAPQYTAAPAGDAAFAPPAGPPPQGGGYAPPGGPPPTGGPGGAGGAQGTPAAPPPEYRP